MGRRFSARALKKNELCERRRAVQQRDAPDEVRDGLRTARPSQVISVFGGRKWFTVIPARAANRGFSPLMMLAITGCVSIGGTQERRLIDLNDGPMDRRLQVAQEYVNDQRLTLLRASARKQFPNLTDRDLATLGLTWQRLLAGDGEHVMVVVTFMPESKDVDAKAVADYIGNQVRDELRPRMRRETSHVIPMRTAPPNDRMQLTAPARMERCS